MSALGELGLYVARFGEWTRNTVGCGEGSSRFFEYLDRHAFAEARLGGLPIHLDHRRPVGRTGVDGRLYLRKKGLYLSLAIPDTAVGRELLGAARSGRIQGGSFQFESRSAAYQGAGDSRTLIKVGTLTDVSISLESTPAYARTARKVHFEDYRRDVGRERVDSPASPHVLPDPGRLGFRRNYLVSARAEVRHAISHFEARVRDLRAVERRGGRAGIDHKADLVKAEAGLDLGRDNGQVLDGLIRSFNRDATALGLHEQLIL
jgi:phage head maturation protease